MNTLQNFKGFEDDRVIARIKDFYTRETVGYFCKEFNEEQKRMMYFQVDPDGKLIGQHSHNILDVLNRSGIVPIGQIKNTDVRAPGSSRKDEVKDIRDQKKQRKEPKERKR